MKEKQYYEAVYMSYLIVDKIFDKYGSTKNTLSEKLIEVLITATIVKLYNYSDSTLSVEDIVNEVIDDEVNYLKKQGFKL